MDTSKGYVPNCLLSGPVMGRAYLVNVGTVAHRCTVTAIDDSRVTVQTDDGVTFRVPASDLIRADAEAWATTIANGEPDYD